jgi:hypothetical protein
MLFENVIIQYLSGFLVFFSSRKHTNIAVNEIPHQKKAFHEMLFHKMLLNNNK